MSEAIGAAYRDILGRDPDAGGEASFEDAIANGETIDRVREIIANSPESDGNIASLFRNELGREAQGFDFDYWHDQLWHGTATLDGMRWAFGHSGDAIAQIDGMYQQIVGHGADNPDLLGAYENNMGSSVDRWTLNDVRWNLAHQATSEAAVAALYHNEWGREASQGELDGWANRLYAGSETIFTIYRVFAHAWEATDQINQIVRANFGRDASEGDVAFWEYHFYQGDATVDSMRWDIAHSGEATADIDAIYQRMLGHPSNDPGLLAAYENNMGSSASKWTLGNVTWDLAHRPEVTAEINSLYRQVLGRDANGAEISVNQEYLGTGGNPGAIVTALVQSGEAANDIDAMYQQILGRPAGGDGIAAQEAGLQAGQSLAGIRHNIATSAEVQQDIGTAFRNELGREAQGFDYAYWEGQLEQGAYTLGSMRTAFSRSPEAQSLIHGAYQQMLGRIARPDELAAYEGALAAGAARGGIENDLAHAAEAHVDFDAAYYLASNPNVAAAGVDPYVHYITSGWKEGRNPSALFNTTYYLQQNPDVAAAGVNPLFHFRIYGWHEGRDPSAQFNTRAYLAAYQDVAAAGMDPLFHYTTYGRNEGRSIVAAVANGGLVAEEAAINTFYYALFARAALRQEIGTFEMAVTNGSSLQSHFDYWRQQWTQDGSVDGVVNAFYQQTYGRTATSGYAGSELSNIDAAIAAGQSLRDIEAALRPQPQTPPPLPPPLPVAAINAFYEQLFGRDALAGELDTIAAALGRGQTLQQVFDYLRPIFVYGSDETALIASVYQQVTGQQADEDTIRSAETEISQGAWLSDVRYEFAHSDAGATAVDEVFHAVLGRSASDVELAIWEDELSDTGSRGSMRSDLAHHATAGEIDHLYRDVLDRGATTGEVAFQQNQLANGATLSDVRSQVAHSGEAAAAVNAAASERIGLAIEGISLAEIEAGLAAGASLDMIAGVLVSSVNREPNYDTRGDVNGFHNEVDPGRVARNVAVAFFQTMFGRGPTIDEVVGIEAALSTTFSPTTEMSIVDQQGKILGHATADKLLTQLPVFVTLNDGATPVLQWPGGFSLTDGAQVAAFLIGIEGRAGRLDQRTLAIYNDVSSWLDQVGQQLLQLAATMSQAYSVEGNADRRVIESEIIRLAIRLAAIPPSIRAQAAQTGQGIERLSLHGHQADLSLFIDPATGEWNFSVHDIDTTDWFRIIVEAVVLVATAVLVLATAGGATPLLSLEVSTILALQVVTVVGNVVLAGESFANGDVLGGVLSLAAAVGAGLVPAGPQGSATALVSFVGSAQTGQLILAARGVIGGIAASVKAAESGNALGLVSSVLSVAASAASGVGALQNNGPSDALKNVGYFLTGVSTATSIANAYNRGDIQGGLMASLNGLLTAYTIANQAFTQPTGPITTVSERSVSSIETSGKVVVYVGGFGDQSMADDTLIRGAWLDFRIAHPDSAYFNWDQSSESIRDQTDALQSLRTMRRIDAQRRKAKPLLLRHSQSLANLRHRLSQAIVRSTTQRRGSRTNPFA